MNNKIIYDCYVGPNVYGVLTAEDTLRRRAIFVEELKNLVGFRTYIPELEHEGLIFYEIGYFLELIYRGSPEAFTMINMGDDFIEKSTHEIRILKDNKDKFISKAVPEFLYTYAKKSAEDLFKENSYFSDEKSVKKLEYDKNIAYICSLYLRIAKDVLLHSEFKVEREDAQILSAIKEGYFSKETIEKEIEVQLEEVEKLLKETRLPPNPSKDLLNQLLFKIRGVENIEEKIRIE